MDSATRGRRFFTQYRAEILNSGKHSADLLHNFRSRSEILRCVESLLNAAEGIDPRELVAGASFAGQIRASIEVLKVHTTGEEDEPASTEARWIAHRILSLRGTLQTRPGRQHPPCRFRRLRGALPEWAIR